MLLSTLVCKYLILAFSSLAYTKMELLDRMVVLGYESEQTLGDSGGHRSLVCCSVRAKNRTQLSN